MKKTKSLLDVLSPEDRERAIERSKKRLERKKARKGLDVSPEMFELAEFGRYFGWDALMAVRRGYTVDPVSGEPELLTMGEVQVFLEAARKVDYAKLIERASAGMASTTAAFSKTPTQTLEDQLQPLYDKSKVTE